MSKDRIEKTIPLSASEFRSYRNLFNMNDAAKRFIAGLLEEFFEGQAEREAVAWDEISQRFGFNSHEELEASGRTVQIDFTSRQLKLFKVKQ